MSLAGATLLACACHAGPATAPSPVAVGDWPGYGRDALGSRYSPLAQIDTISVKQLAVAWTYHTGETSIRTRKTRSFEVTPIVVEGTMYIITPLARIIALDAETGREQWTFDAGLDRTLGFGDHASRGVSTWLDTTRAAGTPCRRRTGAR